MNIVRKYSAMTIFFFLFSLFVGISTFVLIMTTWNEVKRKAIIELKYSNMIVSSAFRSELEQHEILISLLGEQLLEMGVLKDPEKSRPFIEKLIDYDKSLAGFGIAKNDGELIIVSSLPSTTKLPNLLQNPVYLV